MTEAGKRLIEAAQEAVAVAKGEIPAAAIYHNGHKYAPAAELEMLTARALTAEAELETVRKQRDEAWTANAEVRLEHRLTKAKLRSAEAELEKVREALSRQTDNMSFILNRGGHNVHVWRDKFYRQLEEDRRALSEERK